MLFAPLQRAAPVVVLVACAAVHPAPRAAVRGVAARTPRVDLAELDCTLRVLERPADGSLRGLCGGLRVELTPASTTLGDVAFHARIVRAMHLARAWVFVAADGAVARSDSFLGELAPLPSLDLPDTVVEGGAGVASAIRADGAVLRTDGSTPFDATPSQPPARAARARFTGPQHGRAELESGEAFFTVDGGAHWQYAGEPFEAPAPYALGAALLEPEAEPARARLRAALLARNDGYFALRPRTALPDGSTLVETDVGLEEVTASGERRRREGPVTLSMLVRERHGVDLPGYHAYSADLTTAASLEPDDGGPASSLRIGRVDRGVSVVRASRRVEELVGLDRARAWAWAVDPETSRRRPVQIDLATGQVGDLLPPTFEGPCRPGVCEFVADGTLLAVDRGRLLRADGLGVDAVGLPEGATRIAFADASRGMTYGARGDRVWLTRDGARSWQVVELGGPLPGGSLLDRGATCHALGCHVAGLAIEGFDARRLRVHALAGGGTSAASARWTPPWFAHMPAVRCEPDGVLALPPWTRAAPVSRLSTAPVGEVRRFRRIEADQLTCSTALEWRGVDGDGPFHGASDWALSGLCEGDPVAPLRRPEGLARGGFYDAFALAVEADHLRWFRRERVVFVAPARRPWVLFGVDGTTVAQRRLTGVDVTVSPAERGSTPGAIVWGSTEPGRARYVPVDRTVEGSTVTIPTPATLAPCDDATHPEALRVAVPCDAASDTAAPGRALATVEIDGGRACLRDVQGAFGASSYAWPAPGGGLVGVSYDDAHRPAGASEAARLRCSLVVRAELAPDASSDHAARDGASAAGPVVEGAGGEHLDHDAGQGGHHRHDQRRP